MGLMKVSGNAACSPLGSRETTVRLSVFVTLALALAAVALPARAEAQQPEAISLTLECRTNPERTTVFNNTSSPIVVLAILSLFEPGLEPGVPPKEAFAVNHTLPSGATVTFFSGPGSPSPSLSQQFIYDDTQSREGAAVTTSVRSLDVSCAQGSVTVPLIPPGADIGPGGAVPQLPMQSQPVPANSVRVEVSCASEPETVTITNTLASPLSVRTVTSLFQPRQGIEPFVLNQSVPMNHALTLYFGQGASSKTGLVTGFPVFEESVPGEGVQVETSLGSFTVRCGEGSITRTSGAGRLVTPPSTGDGGLVPR